MLGAFNKSLRWGQKNGTELGNVQKARYLEHGMSEHYFELAY